MIVYTRWRPSGVRLDVRAKYGVLVANEIVWRPANALVTGDVVVGLGRITALDHTGAAEGY